MTTFVAKERTTVYTPAQSSMRDDQPRDAPGGTGNASPVEQHGGGLHLDDFSRLPALHSRPERRLSIGSTYSRASEAYGPQGLLLGPKRPRPHKIWKKKYIKIMVVGDSGLGKTTLVKSLISIPGERLQVHDGSYTPTDQFQRDPESLCSTISWRDEEDRCIWVYRIQDTPGYGDELDVYKNLGMIVDHINAQDNKWLELEQSKDRKEDLAELEDPRVDLCLFCIPPHRLRPLDLKYMYEIGRHVPIVPIVTKADTMTIREANTYRQEVANKIANPMLPGIRDKINVFKFERDTLERSGITDGAVPVPPFLVVASNETNDELGSAEPPMYWPERRYPWGIAEAFNREHSDLLSLRALLLKEALEEVNKTKRSRYESWRRERLGGFKLGRRIASTLVWTIIPAFICLQAGRKGIRLQDVKRVVSGASSKIRSGALRLKRGAVTVIQNPETSSVVPVQTTVTTVTALTPKAEPAPAPARKAWGAF